VSGTFELFDNGHSSFGFRLKSPDGVVLAISDQFVDKASAVHAIKAVREYAATGLIADRCTPGQARPHKTAANRKSATSPLA
jgi:uncharacterized protein YegP (UPF0339 family)